MLIRDTHGNSRGVVVVVVVAVVIVQCSTTTVYRELHIFVNKIVNKNENNFMTDAETEHDE